MTVNPNLTQNVELYPFIADGAITAGRAVVASTPDSSKNQRAKQATAAGQNSAIGSVQRFLGVSPFDVADTKQGSIQTVGRIRAIGGGVITAPALVTFDANGKFTSFTVDGTKFGFVVGFAATDCAGDGSAFDLILVPMIIGPASADSVNFTLSGILTALTGTFTGAVTVATTLGVTGDTTLSGNLIQNGAKYHEMKEMAAPAAGGADTVRIFAVDSGAGKTILKAQFSTGAAQTIATEP